ncbi:MAG TPA: hypothetical protein VFZ61_11485 [Polyangiales bacterium]
MSPVVCPACSAALTSRVSQCGACGVVLGEDNRCGRCLATAPVFERTGRHVCSACGETRTRYPNTVVASEAALLQAFETRPARPLLRPLAILVFAFVALALAQRAGAPAWLGVSGAALSLLAAGDVARRGLLLQRRVRARRRYEIEQRIIGLAYCNDGLLSAGLVSDTLRIALSEAQDLLGELARTGRARAEPSVDRPEIIYHFGEAKRTRGLRRSQIP